MKSRTLNIQDLLEKMSHFVWDFKIGDNICYNLQILDTLYESKEAAGNSSILNKLIAIEIVSIIEAALIDLLDRLDQGTNDLPAIDATKIQQIKMLINRDKRPFTFTLPSGQPHTYQKRKNYQMKDLLNILEAHELLGAQGSTIYGKLRVFSQLRNRVHIPNYFRNFHADEDRVFQNESTVVQLQDTLIEIFTLMETIYHRNSLAASTMQSNFEVWLARF